MSVRTARTLGAALIASLVWAGCAEPENAFWTRKGSSDKQFRKVSLACNERAADQIVKEGGGGSCTYNTEGRGTYCTEVDPNDPFAVEQEKRRRERRIRYLYNECMETSGWNKNYEGRGYKGRH